MGFGVLGLVRYKAETGRAVRESRHKHRHAVFVSVIDDRIFPFAFAFQPFTHFPNKFAGRVRAGFQSVANFVDGFVAFFQLVFINVCVVDAVNMQIAQQIVVLIIGSTNVVFVAKGFKKVLVHDVCAVGNNRVNHIVLNHIHHNFLHTRGNKRPRNAQNDGAFFIGEHHIVDFARSGHFARSVGHISKGFHQGNHIVFFEVNVFDGVFEKVFLG